MQFSEEVEKAKEEGKAIVALESTIISHGMPYPQNVEMAQKVEQIVRDSGGVPATIAIIDGKIKIGLSEDELELLASAENVSKVSRRDIAEILATKKIGATTVASTMICAQLADIKFFVTGGIGGVHKG
ncbi:pseudouridine-5'-phosphate glycosidase, partial [Streptococcus danieliae]|nr:pseudouridine-5'-phosphate glycosidase [Streptococcus danieliae]